MRSVDAITGNTLQSVWPRSNRAQHRAGTPQQCLPGGEQQVPHPAPFLTPTRSHLGTVLHVAVFFFFFFFQGAADFRGAIPPPCSHYFNRATQSELLNAAIYRPHSSENSFLPAVNKTSRETPSANGRRSSGGSGAERCGHSAVSAPRSRSATTRRPLVRHSRPLRRSSAERPLSGPGMSLSPSGAPERAFFSSRIA